MARQGAFLGALAGVSLVAAASWMAAPPTSITPAPTAKAVKRTNKPACDLDIGSVRIQGKVDPGLGQANQVPAVPIYRDYVPARVHLLACPSSEACQLPDEMPVHLFTGVGPEPLHRHDMPPEILSRGRCMEFAWSGRASLFWPNAPEGVVRWAVVLDSDGQPKRPADWRREGKAHWSSEVVYAGSDGSPSVH